MESPIRPEPVPLHDDGRGGFRVGASRVPLEVVLRDYERGAGPEAIIAAYSALDLADVYAVIAYYLRHKEEVGAYLLRRAEEARALREEIERNQRPSAELKAKLLQRRAEQQEKGHAAAGG
jgi:uncharacterized protein (DUF433 family)